MRYILPRYENIKWDGGRNLPLHEVMVIRFAEATNLLSLRIFLMIVHLIDGTYELFRHFYGLRRFNKGKDKPLGATVGLLHGILKMIEDGATHLGVATDHVIESFRNTLWEG